DAVGVAVGGVQRAVAEEPVGSAVRIVASTARDGVDHAAHGAAEFGGEAIGENLEFLDGILRDLGGDAGAAGVLVIEAVGSVVTVGEEGVSHGDAAEAHQTELAVVGYAWSQQDEGVHA